MWFQLLRTLKKGCRHFNSYKTPVRNRTSKKWNGLWDTTIETSQPEPPPNATINKHANSFLRLDKKKSELASYLHADSGCPSKSTFIQEINNGNIITWPDLTSKLISEHLLLSPPTLKGHLKQDHQNIRSTKKIATTEKPEAQVSPTQESKKQDFFYRNKGSQNNVLRPHWKIYNYFDSRKLVHCNLLKLWH